MPTTLITQVSGNGLGVMGQSLVEHVPSVKHVIALRRVHGTEIDLDFPAKFNASDEYRLRIYDEREVPVVDNPHDKVIYIESSYGLSRAVKGIGKQTIYVPMWEQGSVPDELQYANTAVSVTKWTQHYLRERHQRDSVYLPWPIDTTRMKPRVVSHVRTILHNAGSLGGNLRKGTLEAIQIFQRSRLAQDGVRLVVHAWKPAPDDVAFEITRAPDGIVWTNEFLLLAEDIYARWEPDLLLMSSKIEGHALVALEAMARGVPALVTDVPPICEYEHDPAYLLPVEYWAPSPLAAPYAIVDVQAGAEKLRALAKRDLSAKSREVTAFVEREMSWKTLGVRWEELCR